VPNLTNTQPSKALHSDAADADVGSAAQLRSCEGSWGAIEPRAPPDHSHSVRRCSAWPGTVPAPRAADTLDSTRRPAGGGGGVAGAAWPCWRRVQLLLLRCVRQLLGVTLGCIRGSCRHRRAKGRSALHQRQGGLSGARRLGLRAGVVWRCARRQQAMLLSLRTPQAVCTTRAVHVIIGALPHSPSAPTARASL
jgi:hypothetical protein